MTILCLLPVSILHKSIAGCYRPVREADGPITARYRFMKNASWVVVTFKTTEMFKCFKEISRIASSPSVQFLTHYTFAERGSNIILVKMPKISTNSILRRLSSFSKILVNYYA